MAGETVFPGTIRVNGDVVAEDIRCDSAYVSNADVEDAASIEASKLQHRHAAHYSQPNTASTTETRTLHVVSLPGTINAVKAGSIAKAVGDSTVTVDVKKNGTTVLTGVITLDSGNTNRVAESGTVSGASSAVVAGDLLETVITATVGTGTLPTGVFVQVEVDEDGI